FHRGITRHHDYDQVRIQLMQAALQLDAVGSSHLDVQQGNVPLAFGHARERVARILRHSDVIALFPEPLSQGIAHAEFIVHNQELPLRFHVNHLPPTTAVISFALGAGMVVVSVSPGRVTVNVVPRPASECTVMVPLWRSRMLWLMARPSPTPRPVSLVVRNGSKMRGRISGGIPAPSSRTTMRTWLASELQALLIHRLPPCGMASIAFMRRARRTCSICAPSHGIRGNPGSSCSST